MEATAVTASQLSRLRRWNLGLSLLHAVQAVVVLLLASGFAITVTSQFPSGPPGAAAPAPEPLFDVAVGPAIAVFLALAALDHLLTATVLRARYETDLRAGLNRFRWIEYSLSATIMVILIGFYNGLTGVNEVVLIIGANVAMILFGWLQELMNPPGRTRTTMLPFWFGCVAGAAPWVAILVNVIGAGDQVPGFVYGIVASLFVFFMSFALNQWL
ncbi:MAG: heliorhodopsin HeR, partial [Nocardioidaceae bacterium]